MAKLPGAYFNGFLNGLPTYLVFTWVRVACYYLPLVWVEKISMKKSEKQQFWKWENSLARQSLLQHKYLRRCLKELDT